jgi:hypothetical protein
MRFRLLLLSLFLVLVGLAGAAQAEVLIFDMGTDTSALWPAAHRVVPSDPGWVLKETPVAVDSPATGNPIWTNPLTQDCIIGAQPAAYRFPAAAGPWSVYVICGIGGHWDSSVAQYWDFTVSLGAEQWRCQMEAPEGRGPYLHPTHVFSARPNGEIEVSLTPRSKWCISGIIAWQPADEATARQLIRKVEQWAPEEELAKWHADVRPPAGPAPALTAADRKRGFYVWHRHWATAIYPWTNPTPDELSPSLRAFAVPGEYEPLTFTVRPLRDMTRAEVKVEAIGPIPADRIEVRKVRCLPARPNYDMKNLYRIVPDILDRWVGGPLPARENATFWLTVHVPEGAKPGLYKSRIRFTGDGTTVELPVLFRIVDAQLSEDPGHTYGIYYDDPLTRVTEAPDQVSRDFWTRKSELEHADMAAHGTRNVTLDCWAGAADEQGKFPYVEESFARLDTELKMAARFGFQPPYVLSISSSEVYEKYMKKRPRSHLQGIEMPPDAFFAEITALVRTIEAERNRRGWPEFVYQPFDEPNSDPGVISFMVRLMQTVKAAGVRTYTTASPERPGYQPLKPYVDVWCTQTFLPDHDTVVADMKGRSGVEYWCYPNDISGENDHTPVAGARMTYGFGFWRSGFVRLIPWMYQYVGGDPFNYLDDGMQDFLVRSDPDGSPIPVALWEAYREGYDDIRYIYTLQQAIVAAQKSPSAETRQQGVQAQRTLDDIWNAVPVRPQYQYDSAWSPEDMDVYRWMIADRLERLTKALRKDGAGGKAPGLPYSLP